MEKTLPVDELPPSLSHLLHLLEEMQQERRELLDLLQSVQQEEKRAAGAERLMLWKEQHLLSQALTQLGRRMALLTGRGTVRQGQTQDRIRNCFDDKYFAKPGG